MKAYNHLSAYYMAFFIYEKFHIIPKTKERNLLSAVIDVHSHVLPGFDDGAVNLEQSTAMLEIAVKNGICEVIATPHYSSIYANTDPEAVRNMCRKVEEHVRCRLKTEIKVWPGQEIMYGDDTAVLLENGRLLTMAGSRYVLVEFIPAASYSYIFNAVRDLTLKGYLPIIAHVERYFCMKEKNRIEELKGQGAYIQMNFRSVSGKWYEDRTRWCRQVLRKRQVDLLGTDMHNTSSRSPEISGAMEWLYRHLDRTYIREITCLNQQKILADGKCNTEYSYTTKGNETWKNYANPKWKLI